MARDWGSRIGRDGKLRRAAKAVPLGRRSARRAANGHLEHLAETLHVERLHDVVERPTRQRLAGETFISVGRDHDNRYPQSGSPRPPSRSTPISSANAPWLESTP